MLLALTDHLRCTGDHADSWLVARADVAERGWMIDGELGCPICDVTRAVKGGVVLWGDSAVAFAHSPAAPVPVDDEAVIRLAALIGLSEGSAPYIVCGDAGRFAVGLGAIADAPLVLLDPPDDLAAGLATIIRGAPRVPLAERSARGVALDAAHASAGRVEFAVRVLARGGRLVAPADIAVPAGIRELARDARNWVGERVADDGNVSKPVAIGRAPRTAG